MKRFPLLRSSEQKPGQAMVEFGLVMPLLMLLVVGLLEVGRLIFIDSTIILASREAARYGTANIGGLGSEQYKDCTGIVAAAQNVDFLNSFDNSGVTINYYNGMGVLLDTINGNSCHLGPTVPSGGYIKVTVQGSYIPLLGIIPLNPMTLYSTSSRTILGIVNLTGLVAPPGLPVPSDVRLIYSTVAFSGENTSVIDIPLPQSCSLLVSVLSN